MQIVFNALRSLFSWIDQGVYGLVEILFQLILDLANVRIFSDSVISEFANRLYIILGLIMVFKLMISFIQIIVNPEKMDDKEQGISNILKRVIISLVLIVLVPSIFDLARTVQDYVIPVIPRVLLGKNLSGENSDITMSDAGRTMAFQSFLAFFDYDNPSCNDGSIYGITSSDSNSDNVIIYDVATAHKHIKDDDTCSTDEYSYKYKYTILLSTALGVYLLYTLISIAVYVAIRALKLAICEFIAPIPIASYIDPKTSKQSFDSWVKVSVQTYLDLFISLIGVYFIAFVLTTLFNNPETLTTMYGKLGGSTRRATLVTIFIIIGLLKFAKDFPKFLTNLLGFKEGGILGDVLKMAGGLASATGGAIVGGVGNMFAAKGAAKPFSAAAGFTSGLFHGGREALFGNKSAKEIYTSTVRGIGSRRNQRIADHSAGVGMLDRARVGFKDYFQIKDDSSLLNDTEKAVSTSRGDISNLRATAKKRIHDKELDIGFNRTGSKVVEEIERQMQSVYDELSKSSNATLREFADKFYKDTSGNVHLSRTASLNVRDINTFAEVAKQQSLGIGTNLSDAPFISTMDKELTEDMLMGRAVYGDGTTLHESFNINGPNVDKDITGDINKLKQNIKTNIGDLGEITISTPSGNITLRTAEDYQRAIQAGLALQIDKALQDKQNELSANASKDRDFAARAANQRRKDSK